MSEEVWRDIEGYEGLYRVSNLGRVKSLPKKRKNGKGSYVTKEIILKSRIGTTGYYFVRLKNKNAKVHRLIALAFIPNPENKPQVNHIDGDKLNNKITNLEWVTNKENIRHAYDTGLNKRRNILNKEELENLYINKRLGPTQIGKIMNLSYNVIERELKRHGFKLRNKSEADTKYFITKDFLEIELKNKTQTQIAKELKCDQSLISFYKKKFNL